MTASSPQTRKAMLQLLKHLAEQGGQSEAKERVLSQLVSEGWEEHPVRPGSWLRYCGGASQQYIVHTPYYGKYNTKHSAVMALKKQGVDKAYIARFVTV